MAQIKEQRAASGSDRRSVAQTPVASNPGSPRQSQSPQRPSKKVQIVSLYNAGIEELTDIAAMVRARPSYVASVLQDAGLLPVGYYDLYTSTRRPMNIYSKFFTGKLGFRDEGTARKSIALIDELYRQFAFAQDRVGQTPRFGHGSHHVRSRPLDGQGTRGGHLSQVAHGSAGGRNC
jgi:hypothetical protein